MKNKTAKSQTLLRVGIVLVILVLLNIISVRIFGRLDVTKNNVFSLSDASKELVRNLDDKVTVKAYFTEDLPAPYNNNRRAILLDQLNEYKAYARGNLQYEFIDPSGEKARTGSATAGHCSRTGPGGEGGQIRGQEGLHGHWSSSTRTGRSPFRSSRIPGRSSTTSAAPSNG